MGIRYEVVSEEEAACIKPLCDGLMAYQKAKARLFPELFDGMSFKTRMLPSLASARANHILVAKDGEVPVGYAYSNIASKTIYAGKVATLECGAFFDMDSVEGEEVGCLSQFFIREEYRNRGIGGVLFRRSMDWLDAFPAVRDRFIFVSNGNDQALHFYMGKGFRVSHMILGGFITVLRNLGTD